MNVIEVFVRESDLEGRGWVIVAVREGGLHDVDETADYPTKAAAEKEAARLREWHGLKLEHAGCKSGALYEHGGCPLCPPPVACLCADCAIPFD